MTGQPWPVVGFSGHRRVAAGDAVWLVHQVLPRVARQLADEHGTTRVLSGMALGGDLWWARACRNAGLELEAHIPFPQQADAWPAAEQARRSQLLAEASGSITYGDLRCMPAGPMRKRVATQLLHTRNDGMLLRGDAFVVAHYPDQLEGGTTTFIRKLEEEARRPFVRIDLRAHTVTLRAW